MLGSPPEKPIRLTSILMLILHSSFFCSCFPFISTVDCCFFLWVSFEARLGVGATRVFGIMPRLFIRLRYNLRCLVIGGCLVFICCWILPSGSATLIGFSNVATTSPLLRVGSTLYSLVGCYVWKWTFSLSTLSVKQPASTLINALPVAKNGRPRISRALISFPLSNTIKSTG